MAYINYQNILHYYAGKPEVKKCSSHEYEGLNMDDREETANATGVYTKIQRNSKETAGKQISFIIELTLRATECSSSEKQTYMGLQKFIYMILLYFISLPVLTQALIYIYIFQLIIIKH